MIIVDEAVFLAEYPKLAELCFGEAKRDNITLSEFLSMHIEDEEYATVRYANYEVLAQGSEDGTFGEWSFESGGEL